MVALGMVTIAVVYIAVAYMKSIVQPEDMGIEPPKKKKNSDIDSMYRTENEALKKENEILRQLVGELYYTHERIQKLENTEAVLLMNELNWRIDNFGLIVGKDERGVAGIIHVFNQGIGETYADRTRISHEVDNMIAVRRMINGDFD